MKVGRITLATIPCPNNEYLTTEKASPWGVGAHCPAPNKNLTQPLAQSSLSRIEKYAAKEEKQRKKAREISHT